jgi:hypothetical protein
MVSSGPTGEIAIGLEAYPAGSGMIAAPMKAITFIFILTQSIRFPSRCLEYEIKIHSKYFPQKE